MKEPKVSDVKKYLNGIIKAKRKYVTCERLSKIVGVYPEIIASNLAYFQPMIKMDPEYNLLELVPTLKKYLNDKEESKSSNIVRTPVVYKKEVEQYEGITDFIYRKYASTGGLIDRNAQLSDKDLKVLKKLISEEQAKRKANKK